MSFDLESATVPQLLPLASSFAADSVESELRDLFAKLFKEGVGADVFDANVAGMMHLGTFDLIRKAVNFDGLTLTDWQGAEEATRYLYRAWKSRNRQGRGLHFLRTYLQMLFPNGWDVVQLWQNSNVAYPTDLGDDEQSGFYLTSRIRIGVDAQSVGPDDIDKVKNSIHSVIAARFVPSIVLTGHADTKLRIASIATAASVMVAGGELSDVRVIGKTALSSPGLGVTVAILKASGELSTNQIGP